MYSLAHHPIILLLRTGASSGVLYQIVRNKNTIIDKIDENELTDYDKRILGFGWNQKIFQIG
jgi:hypothetical protein